MRIRGFRVEGPLTPEHMVGMRLPENFWSAKRAMIENEDLALVCDNYLRDLDDHLDNGYGLLLWGANGTGKTTAAAVVAKWARQRGASVLFITAESLRHAAMDKEKYDDDLLVLDRAKSADMVVIDDLGKEHSSEWSHRMMENVLRVRASSKKSTIITTNIALPELVKVYSVSFMEILKEMCLPVLVDGESYRNGISEALREKLTKK